MSVTPDLPTEDPSLEPLPPVRTMSQDNEPSPRIFVTSLLVSVLFHLFLLLIVIYVPGLADLLVSHNDLAVAEETSLKFTFAPPAEQNSDGAAQPAAEATPPVPVPPSREPSIDISASTPVPLGEAVPSLPTAREERETREQEAEQERKTQAEPDRATKQVELAEEIDPRPDQEQPASAPPSFDLGRALRDFEGALAAAQAASPRSGGVPTNVFRPDATELPFAGFGVGNLEFGTRDYDWNDYGRQIYIAIWREWHKQLYYGVDEFERWAHSHQEWLAKAWDKLEFVIESNGGVSRVTLLSGDGMEPLDASTVRTLESVVLPPLPEDFTKDRETIRVTFLLSGDIRTMRRAMEWMRQQGYFNVGRDYGPLPKPKERSR